jgi:hypothetical protein
MKKKEINSSILHVIEYLRMEHHYPVNKNYEFGIPYIKTECKCECTDKNTICDMNSDKKSFFY